MTWREAVEATEWNESVRRWSEEEQDYVCMFPHTVMVLSKEDREATDWEKFEDPIKNVICWGL